MSLHPYSAILNGKMNIQAKYLAIQLTWNYMEKLNSKFVFNFHCGVNVHEDNGCSCGSSASREVILIQ